MKLQILTSNPIGNTEVKGQLRYEILCALGLENETRLKKLMIHEDALNDLLRKQAMMNTVLTPDADESTISMWNEINDKAAKSQKRCCHAIVEVVSFVVA